jgi:DNA mismatch repair protein MutS
VLRQFRVKSLKGLGVEEKPLAVLSLSALLSYLFETQKQDLSHLAHLNVYDTSGHMSLDKATIKNLELTRPF